MIRIVVAALSCCVLTLGCLEKTKLSLPTSCTIEGRCEIKPTVQETCDCAGIDLRYLSIEDSRCPTGAVCVWSGEITVKLLANQQDTVGFTLTGDLSNANVRVDSLENKALRLIGLFPYPQVDQELKPSDYFIVLQWEEL